MRGLGAAARRGAHLPSSYASAFSSFSGFGGGGGGAGRGRGRGNGSGPSPFGQPRAPGRPIPDDHGADSFYAPHSIGRGRGEPVVPSSPTVPPFSAFSGAGRGRGSPPPAAEDAPKRPEDASPIYDPERARLGASSSALPRSIPFTGAGRGRGSPLSPPPAAEDTPKQHITKRPEDASPISDPERPRPDASSSAPPSSIPSTGAGLGRVSPLPLLPSSEDAPKQHITKRPEDASFSPLPRSIPSTGAGRGVPRFQQPPADKAPEENRFIRRREAMKAAASSPGAPSTQPKLSAQDALKRALERLGGGEGAGGRGRNRGGRSRDRGRGRGESDDRYMVYLGENADGEKLEKRLGEDKMKILEKAFEEAADNALPHPMEDAYMDACHTNNMIEFEPEYHVNFDNPDIDDKPPMSLEEMLQKVKPLIVAYEGIQNQEEWEEAVKDVMARAPHMKELIDMYSGPDVVTAIQQEQELRRVANTLPENIPSSVNRFTDKMLLSLKNNPGWGFDKKCQFMDKYAREVSNLYK